MLPTACATMPPSRALWRLLGASSTAVISPNRPTALRATSAAKPVLVAPSSTRCPGDRRARLAHVSSQAALGTREEALVQFLAPKGCCEWPDGQPEIRGEAGEWPTFINFAQSSNFQVYPIGNQNSSRRIPWPPAVSRTTSRLIIFSIMNF